MGAPSTEDALTSFCEARFGENCEPHCRRTSGANFAKYIACTHACTNNLKECETALPFYQEIATDGRLYPHLQPKYVNCHLVHCAYLSDPSY